MRIAIVAPPFIPVPPNGYGGTELFVAYLAEALSLRGLEVTVYANGESTVACPVRWTFPEKDWPPGPGVDMGLKNLDHSAWAIRDIREGSFDVAHLNDAAGVPMSRFLPHPVVHTLHHPHDESLSTLYKRHPWITYVSISDAQKQLEEMPRMHTIHHGIRLEDYRFESEKKGYLAFLGRMAPVKGPHLAIEVARRAGLPLKLAGEVQPLFDDYWKTQVLPGIDGREIEFVGEATLDIKNELLSNASALLFPIQWNEPFGLVMIEAMACGTPVIALPGGAVPEVVRDGVSGWICRDIDEMVERAADVGISPASCRDYTEREFSVERMAADYEELYRACLDEPFEFSLDGDGAALGS
jgi:glycosyltransferase involved in cell wall biosynthesis